MHGDLQHISHLDKHNSYNTYMSLSKATNYLPRFTSLDRLAGLVVKVSAPRAEDPGSNPACARIFPGSSHTSDLKIGTPVATLPGAWRYRVSTENSRPGVSIL